MDGKGRCGPGQSRIECPATFLSLSYPLLSSTTGDPHPCHAPHSLAQTTTTSLDGHSICPCKSDSSHAPNSEQSRLSMVSTYLYFFRSQPIALCCRKLFVMSGRISPTGVAVHYGIVIFWLMHASMLLLPVIHRPLVFSTHLSLRNHFMNPLAVVIYPHGSAQVFSSVLSLIKTGSTPSFHGFQPSP